MSICNRANNGCGCSSSNGTLSASTETQECGCPYINRLYDACVTATAAIANEDDDNGCGCNSCSNGCSNSCGNSCNGCGSCGNSCGGCGNCSGCSCS